MPFAGPADVYSMANVNNFGAKHDWQSVSDAAMGIGSTTISSSTAIFTSGDVGKIGCMASAKADTVSDLCGTVSTVTDSHHIVFSTANASGNALTSQNFQWGTDDTAAFTAAMSALVAANGGTLFVPAGDYAVCGSATSTCLAWPDPDRISIRLVGAGAAILGAAPFSASKDASALHVLSATLTGPLIYIHANPNTYTTHSSVEHISLNYGTTKANGVYDAGTSDCVDIIGVSFTRLNDIACDGFPQDGLFIGDADQFGITNIEVYFSDFDQNGRYGINLPAGQAFLQNMHFDNLRINDNFDAGFEVDGTVHGWELGGGTLLQRNDHAQSTGQHDLSVNVAQDGCEIHSLYLEADNNNEHTVYLKDGSCSFHDNQMLGQTGGTGDMFMGTTFGSTIQMSYFNNNVATGPLYIQCLAATEGIEGMKTDNTASPTFGGTYGGGSGSNVNKIGCDGTNWRYGW